MHKVICVYCQEQFDRDTVKCQKVGRRYAHLTCHEPRIDVNGASYGMIIQYCGKIFGDETNFGRIGKQIKDYITQGMSYKGIYLALKYWYEVKHESKERAAGAIGIVPYIYKEAREYWAGAEPKRIPKMEEEIVYIKRKPNKTRENILARLLDDDDEGEE